MHTRPCLAPAYTPGLHLRPRLLQVTEHPDFCNGTLAVVTEINACLQDGTPALLTLEAVGSSGERGRPMRVRRETVTMTVGQKQVTRTQFPLVPAFACTVHRTQGSTIPSDVHILRARAPRTLAPPRYP